MNSRSLLAVFLLVTLLIPTTASAKEGEFKVGALVEYRDAYDSNEKDNAYGTPVGVSFGYEKEFGDNWWWGANAIYQYASMLGDAKYDSGRIRAKGLIGKSYDFSGVEVRPFVGFGVDWEAMDGKDAKDAYMTDYVLPLGVSAQKDLSTGLLGADFTFEYVLRREVYATEDSGAWGSRNFDGSWNTELGIFYEPNALPVGLRPYFRYEKLQHTKYWDDVDRSAGGIEVYYKF